MRAVLDRYVVPEGAAPMRLDQLASSVFEGFPTRGSARKAAKRGELAVDGVPAEPARFVRPGAEVTWLEPEVDHVPVMRLAVPVVFEDPHLAVLLKPGGLPTSGPLPRTLERALPHNLQPTGEPDALRRPRPVHRLDAPTSGLVVVAKTRTAHARLGWAFQERRVQKRYGAVVSGRLEGEGTFDAPLDERPAVTRYRALAHGHSLHVEWLTRLDLWPETGRTHQLRRHLSAAGHLILGDVAYGCTLRSKGLFLFAAALALEHPVTGEPLTFEATEPRKFRTLWAREQRRWERTVR